MSEGLMESANQSKFNRIMYIVILSVTVGCAVIPLKPVMLQAGLDPSWAIGLNTALASGMIFGKDIVFTLGPYSPIATKCYNPNTHDLMILVSLYLTVSIIVALYYATRYQSMIKKMLMIPCIACIVFGDTFYIFYIFSTYIFILTTPSNKRMNEYIIPTAIIYSSIGVLPLIKGSFVVAVLSLIVHTILILLCRMEIFRVIVCLICLIIGTMLFGYVVGMSPLDTYYYVHMFEFIKGYSDAMSRFGNNTDIYVYISISLLMIILTFYFYHTNLVEKIITISYIALMLFLVFKAGFVRHDGHAMIASCFLPLAALLCMYICVCKKSVMNYIFILSCFGSMYINSNYHVNPIRYYEIAKYKYYDVLNYLVNYNIRYSKNLSDEYNISKKIMQDGTQLIKLSGTSDIYSHDICSLLCSENKWNPRPVFQSYAAYTKTLAELNLQHLQDTNRPDNIVLKLSTIDGRYPMLDDGPSMLYIIKNYHPLDFKNGYLYLNRSPEDVDVIHNMKRVQEGKVSFNESITIPEGKHLYFIKLHINKTLFGKFLNYIYKTPIIKIRITLTDNTTKEYRLIQGMAESGFIISPLIRNSDDFYSLYKDVAYINKNKVKDITIYSTGLHWCYEQRFDYSIYEIDF